MIVPPNTLTGNGEPVVGNSMKIFNGRRSGKCSEDALALLDLIDRKSRQGDVLAILIQEADGVVGEFDQRGIGGKAIL